ncbi:amidohydrolase [Myxococcota bacterium]|nr:amidohydrolase [Myxococcota bacterium]
MTASIRTPIPLLPDPEPCELKYTFISVDDHLVEPPEVFEGRLPRALQEHAPKVVEDDSGAHIWEFEGRRYHPVGFDAAAGRKPETVKVAPARFEELRPGTWRIEDRIRDMDLGGVWASLNFPSQVTGFGGSLFASAKDQKLGLEVTRAYNDWIYEGWHLPYPDRIIPLGITWLQDPELGAAEVRRNAARGFKALTLPDRPHLMGFPSVFSGFWDPIVEACAETGTVINLHVGSSGHAVLADDVDMPTRMALSATLFGQLAVGACAEWLWSGLPVKFPEVKISMAEGGIGWVAMLLDRVDNIMHRSGYGRAWPDSNTTPPEVLKRNFWFCTIDDPSTISTRYTIGVENIMLESDYPHGDTTWPNTQDVIDRFYGELPVDEIRAMTHGNAAALYRHPLPDRIIP